MTDTPKSDYTRKDIAFGLFGDVLRYGGILSGIRGIVEANVDKGIAYVFLGGALYVLASPLKIIHDVKVERMLLSQLEERLQANDKESKD